MIGQTLSHFRISAKLGEGGMGAVYVAEDETLGRSVALKVLPPEMADNPERLRRFEREAKTVAALNHPNIVTIHSVEKVDGVHFITMELVDGESLESHIPSGGMELERFLALAVPLADALDAAHARGIIHRDLKPANVMLSAEGRVKVLDFGLAKLAQAADDDEDTQIRTQTLTQEGTLLGTVPYMSPEQVQALPTDSRTDIFSLGVMLYEMATGKRPFAGETQAALISSILKDVPQPANEVKGELPNHLGRVIRRCLEKDPGRRYQTARDLKNELEELEREAGAEQPEKIPSMAVLPFADFSPEKDQDYFCEGIAEEIINLLVKVEGLRVASRTSAFQIKDAATDIREIGEKLNVDTVLGGSVRKAGDRLRVTAQLINVADGYHIWSERYDRTMEDIFAIQDEIGEAIVEALKIELSPEAKAGKRKKEAETDPQAYDLYLRGRKAFWDANQEGYERARESFARALMFDPGYARAYAGVADCCSMLYMYHESTTKNLREAKAASMRAIEVDPGSAAAHASRGLALSLSDKIDEASEEFDRAIELEPKLFEAHYFYARALFTAGITEKAGEHFKRAAEVNPEDYQAPFFLALAYTRLDREAGAEKAFAQAVRRTSAHLELHPDDHRAYELGASAYVRLGNLERAEEWAKRATTIDPKNPGVWYNAACTFAQINQVDKAIDALEHAAGSGWADYRWAENDPDLDALRGNERFEELLEGLRKR